MIKLLISQFKQMDQKIKKIMHYGFIFSFIVCLISLFILHSYTLTFSPELYYIGLSIFRLSLFFAVEFIICALAIDTIKKQMC